jgi:hypothetical protein
LVQLSVAALAGMIAGPLLRAENEDDLTGALDEAAESDAFAKYLDLSNRLAAAPKFPDRMVGVSISFALQRSAVLGQEAADVCAEVDRTALILLEALAREHVAKGPRGPGASSQGFKGRPTAFLTEPSMPAVMKRMLLDAFRGIISHLAIRHAIDERRPLESWLAMALARADLHGIRSAVRVVATLHPGIIKSELVPGGELDRRELFETVRRTRAWVEKACADESGRDVGEPDSES